MHGADNGWTILIYMGAVGNALADNDNVLIEKLQNLRFKSSSIECIYQIAYVDETVRYRVGSEGHIARLPPIDTTEPRHITEFVDWSLAHYPSRHTALFLKDHGNGWLDRRKVRGGTNGLGIFLNGKHDSQRYMPTEKLRTAIEKSKQGRVDLIGLDACQMGTVEVAFELKDVASLFVASPSSLPTVGWAYPELLSVLDAHPSRSTREVAQDVVRHSKNFQLVATELAWMRRLAEQINQLSDEVMDTSPLAHFDNIVKWIAADSPATEARQLPTLIADLKKWNLTSPVCSDDRVKMLEATMRAARVSSSDDSTGLSLFFPEGLGSLQMAAYGSLKFARVTGWTSFLSTLNSALLWASTKHD